MCGRFALADPEKIQSRFKTENKTSIEPMFNISPGVNFPIILNQEKRLIEMMRWGLIPFWAKDPSIGNRLINARAETINQKPSFRRSFAKQRCLIPASGFYEWQKTERGKNPYYIELKSHDLFAFAGLYDTWQNSEGEKMKTFTIITCQPNSLLASIHDRMPVILNPKTENVWLDINSSSEKILDLLQPSDEQKLDCFQVSNLVNSPENDSGELIKPLSQTPNLFN